MLQMSTMSFEVRKPCPGCGKPMERVPDDAGFGHDRYICTNCDSVDPLKNPVARGWADSSLKPPSL